MEPNTNHGGGAAELRCRYIFKYCRLISVSWAFLARFFRFYDRDCDGFLNFNEFSVLIQDARKVKQQPVTPDAVKQEAVNSYK